MTICTLTKLMQVGACCTEGDNEVFWVMSEPTYRYSMQYNTEQEVWLPQS